LQINISEDVGEITKVRVGFIDPSKTQQWYLLKVGDKILLLFLCLLITIYCSLWRY